MRRGLSAFLSLSVLLALVVGLALPNLDFGVAQAHNAQPAPGSPLATLVVTINVSYLASHNQHRQRHCHSDRHSAGRLECGRLASVPITLTSSRPADDVITPASATTNASGQATFHNSVEKNWHFHADGD
jgi:K+-transporting ATPase c subunit